MWLRQNTALTLMIGPFLDDADGKTAETGLSITQANIRLSKAGGAFAQCHNAAGATHGENGWYALILDAQDVDTLGGLTVAIAVAGALPVWVHHQVLPAAVYDSLVADTDKLPVNIVQYMGDDCPGADAAGYPVVTLKQDLLVPISLIQAVSGAQIAGSVGDALRRAITSLDAAVSTRSSHSAADVWAAANRTLTSFGSLVSDVWAALLAGMVSAGSVGKLLKDNLDTAVSTRSSHSAGDVWAAANRTLTSFGSLVSDVWAALLAGMVSAGSVGKLLRDNLDTAVSTRSSHSAADVWTVATRTLTSFGTLVADVWNALVAGLVAAGSIGKLLVDYLDSAVSSRSSHTAADAAGATWDAVQAQHAVPGSFGAAIGQSGGGEADWTAPERAQIRQALGVDGEKAATAGGNVDTLLTRTAGAVTFTVHSPVASSGKITLVSSDDYSAAETREIAFRDKAHGLNLAGATVKLRLVERVGDAETGAATEITGTIATDEADAVYSFTLTAAQTAALKVGVNRYFYGVVLSLANGHVLTRAQGLATTIRQSGAAK